MLNHVSPVGIFRTTAEGQTTYVNQRWCEITGITAAAAHGSDWLQAIYPDDRERVTTECQQATQSVPLECFQSRYRFQRSNSTIWVFVQVVANYDSDGTLSGYVGTTTDITQRQQAEETLWQQTERERLVAAIVQEIRRHLDLSHVLKTTVTEVRRLLQTDRVLFFRFESDWSGTVLIESVGTDWKSIQGEVIEDPCFAESYVHKYRNGQTRAVSNIRTEYPQPSCYVEMLADFQVNAELVVPILQNDELWGLLIVHHCSEPRHWQPWETDLLKQLAAQVSIAIQQSELYQEVQRLNAELEQQVQTRTAQLQLAFNFEATLKRIADRVRDSLDEDQILQ
ncbi:MAG TPA: GAF domain-containing protein, partial [Crinalium sp.]